MGSPNLMVFAALPEEKKFDINHERLFPVKFNYYFNFYKRPSLMTPENYLSRKLMLPHLKLINVEKISNKTLHFHCIKKREWEVCRKCPTKSYKVHDHRTVTIRDTKFHS